jgi:hypothetical protein
VLGQEAGGRGNLQPGSKISDRPARDQHDNRRVGQCSQEFGDREAVGVGQVYVQQHQIGSQIRRLGQRPCAVHGFTNHVQPVALQKSASDRAESFVVINDQNAWPHRLSVACLTSAVIRADPHEEFGKARRD